MFSDDPNFFGQQRAAPLIKVGVRFTFDMPVSLVMIILTHKAITTDTSHIDYLCR